MKKQSDGTKVNENAEEPGTAVNVASEEEWFADDEAVMQAKEFDEWVLSKLRTTRRQFTVIAPNESGVDTGQPINGST